MIVRLLRRSTATVALLAALVFGIIAMHHTAPSTPPAPMATAHSGDTGHGNEHPPCAPHAHPSLHACTFVLTSAVELPHDGMFAVPVGTEHSGYQHFSVEAPVGGRAPPAAVLSRAQLSVWRL